MTPRQRTDAFLTEQFVELGAFPTDELILRARIWAGEFQPLDGDPYSLLPFAARLALDESMVP
ncbi:hypothetical protein ACFT5B_03835 [Luteimicrobium sp. NPDC057192]|uniref:hypothetical protein n=1 Tax=Luteimicrobium sp. NPDC057192 TaxID=3346042 RepID=UPI00362C6B9C